jgi:hypothetical protein
MAQAGLPGNFPRVRDDDAWIADDRIGVNSAERPLPRQPAALLLEVMADRGGWSQDALTEATGLSVREIQVALFQLELGGRVRRTAFAFDPV